MRLLKMACNRRKKTILYSLCFGALVYMGVQVVYLSETFTPLMMLSDAQSEASRLLKFISHYHYQCNSTQHMFNRTDWPLCTDKKYGVDVDEKGARIAYSIGPSWDYAFERNLIYNHSFNLFIFSLDEIPRDLKEINRTHYYKTMIVANDPADFGRNSYGTQTLNSVMEAFHHSSVDILKIDQLADKSHAYELLYYMAEDHFLPRFHQLHVTVHIDKLDDDYLYRWYRAFYNLFYHEGFRLYHTSASDPLCLQVTMMESCVYYTSWIRDPGPKVFVMHPPAIDGSLEFEEQRLLNYVENVVKSCDQTEMLSGATELLQTIPSWHDMAVCTEPVSSQPCLAVVIGNKPVTQEIKMFGKLCQVVSLVPSSRSSSEPQVIMSVTRHRYVLQKQPKRKELSLREAVAILQDLNEITWLYMDLSSNSLNNILTTVLDLELLKNVKQVGLDVVISPERYAINVRKTFSELQRIQAQRFEIFFSTPFKDSKLRFLSASQQQSVSYRVSFIKVPN